MSWKNAGMDAYKAARSLQKERPRSCVSRAYYAVYSIVTHELSRTKGVSFPPDREGPAHALLPKLIDKLKRMDDKDRRDLKAVLRRLYAARLDADYDPFVTVDASVAWGVLMDANIVLKIFQLKDE
jgi:uncharacterized protein (UPF0332 family)